MGAATSLNFSAYYLQYTEYIQMVNTLTKFQITRYFLYVNNISIILNLQIHELYTRNPITFALT